jgi:hypothetical protein
MFYVILRIKRNNFAYYVTVIVVGGVFVVGVVVQLNV